MAHRAPNPIWHPESLAGRLPFLQRRAALTRAVRRFFEDRSYTEVETPYAVAAPGEEVHLGAFATRRTYPDGTLENLWLHTSPEFAMKRLLVAGAGPIFQFARVWRNGEGSALHAAEFTMLEWYRPGPDPHGGTQEGGQQGRAARGSPQVSPPGSPHGSPHGSSPGSPPGSMNALIAETTDLLRSTLPPVVRCRGITTDLSRFERLTVAEAFARHVGVDLLAIGEDAAGLASAAGVRLRAGETWEDLFFRLLLERIEPVLGRQHPTFLSHWPAAQAALARRDPADPRVAERFELFVCGIELANAFVELTDPVEQRARFVADRARRHALYGPDWPLDEDFLAALEHGMPSAAGIALGFDRMAMIASGADRIDQVLWLPQADRAGVQAHRPNPRK
jgi:lysyl-tRNA synthetase class 2